MALINGMIEDENNGVCLKKNRRYYNYIKILSGCTYYDTITEINENYNTGMYVLPYINKNPNYTGDTLNEFLIVTGITMSAWFINYINSLVTTGYTGNYEAELEDRIIYNEIDDEYYRIDHYSDYCDVDISDKWGIVDYITNEIWDGTGDYFYDILDVCDDESGERYVKTIDINEYSATYKNAIIYDKELTETLPIITTNSINVLSSYSLNISGNIISNGGFNIKRSGFCYSRNRTPDINDVIILSNNWIIGTYDKTIINLSEDRYYYIRAFAENAIGVSYGETKIIKTFGIDGFSVTTSGPSNIGVRKLDISGEISNPTLVNIKTVGICWGTEINPTISNNKIYGTYTSDNFIYTINNLTNGKTYYFRSYAITKNFGVFYGDNVSKFIGGAPILSELTIFNYNIDRNYAEVSSNILDIGWPNAINEAGFCYSTHSGTTTGDTKIVLSDPINSFKKIIAGLSANTTYYIKGYATNNINQTSGLTYTNELVVTTKDNSEPIISQISVTPISNKQIDVIGTILDDGGLSITNYGVCWCKVDDYIYYNASELTTGTTSGHSKSIGINIPSGGDFSTSITTNLTGDTNYYVNAYAVNSSGITYSNMSDVWTYQNITLNIFSNITLSRVSLTTNNGHETKTNAENFEFNDIMRNTQFDIDITCNYNYYITAEGDVGLDSFEIFEVYNNDSPGSAIIHVNTGEYFNSEYTIFVYLSP